MNNEITRYFPGFFDVGKNDRITIPFNTMEELIELPFVKDWKECEGFHQYAISSGNGPKGQNYLMGQLDEGYEWWVIGVLKHPVDGLPEHEFRYKNK